MSVFVNGQIKACRIWHKIIAHGFSKLWPCRIEDNSIKIKIEIAIAIEIEKTPRSYPIPQTFSRLISGYPQPTKVETSAAIPKNMKCHSAATGLKYTF
jgi:hypothetical protein